MNHDSLGRRVGRVARAGRWRLKIGYKTFLTKIKECELASPQHQGLTGIPNLWYTVVEARGKAGGLSRTRIGCDRRGERGMTMTEIAVVLAILGILVTMAVTTYISYIPHLRLNNESRKMALDLLLARQLAIKENRIFYTCLTTSTEKYEVFRLTASAEDGAPCDGAGNEQLYKSYTLDTGVDLSTACQAGTSCTAFSRMYSCPDGLTALVSSCPDSSSSFPLTITLKVTGGPDPESRLISIRLSGVVTVK